MRRNYLVAQFWAQRHATERRSEALPVNDGGAGLIILALGDPHLLEG
eukprot:CAMPEP_0183384260 /NCGR_PEP_ID=MMETSP0370-20130417/369_1 /TAXON_ID=268820 /ORGANISM="Peridinium aciculiferum, Strain PAER-2" /LENGTH=46 /DNA_ID= /DNA_START= /DNA_END= /DNA_ORIENTATION=